MHNFRKYLPWVLLIVATLYIISGFGITRYRIIESLTFGFLSKALSFKIHDALKFIFIPILLLHVYLTAFRSRKK